MVQDTVSWSHAMPMRGHSGTFPPTHPSIDSADLLAAYDAGPERLRYVIGGLPPSALQARPLEGKWSILEIAIHVVDSELMGAGRIRGAIGQPGMLFAGYDQDAWTAGLGYQEASPAQLAQALDLFDHLRATTRPCFDQLDRDPMPWGVHPEYGPVTLRNLLELYADHSERHVGQILERRSILGCPVSLTPLLSLRD